MNTPLKYLDAQGASEEISQLVQNLQKPREDWEGTLQIDVATTVDAPLLQIRGERGEITLEAVSGRLNGWIRLGETVRQLDAEDAVGLDDGALHNIALSVDNTGTHLFYDGYEIFSATTHIWFADLGPLSLRVNPEGLVHVHRFALWSAPLSPAALMAQANVQKPFIEFATAELSARDAKRTSSLTHGALRARFRTRGEGQGGVIVAAASAAGSLTLSIQDGAISYRVTDASGEIASVRAPGHFDDGDWHDLVVASGRGAIDLYVDGFQVVHEAGTAFFANLGQVERVVVGMSLEGTRLFGEAQSAMIYDCVLGDHQVKRLAGVMPLRTYALFDSGMDGSRSYRIPSLLTLASGTVLAGADQRVSIANDSPNDINFVMRRSTDGGQTWEESRTVLRYPGSGRLGASVIDSVLVQDRSSGRVFVLIDQFPGGVGQPNAAPGTGHDRAGRLILTDAQGTQFCAQPDGLVLDEHEQSTAYHLFPDGSVEKDSRPAGNIHLAVGEDPNESLHSARTAYLCLIYSDDEGQSWSKPRDITAMVKEEWMRFLGTSPGNGICLEKGEHAGRLLVPVYYNHESGKTFSCAAIYSDDGGANWSRGASPNDGRLFDGVELSSRDLEDDAASLHESALVEDESGAVHVFMRNQHPSGRVAHAVSEDGGESWGPVEFMADLPEIFSQPNAITVVSPDGHSAILFANASQMLPFRGRGVLRLSYDGGRTWAHNRVLNPRHHVYQSMAQLPDGRIAVLWEREWQGLFMTELPWSWLASSRSSGSLE